MRHLFVLVVLIFLNLSGCHSKQKVSSKVSFQGKSHLRIQIVPEAGGKYSFGFGEDGFPILERLNTLKPIVEELSKALHSKTPQDVFISWNDTQVVAAIIPCDKPPSAEVTKTLRRLLELNGPIAKDGSWSVVVENGQGYIIDRESKQQE